MCALRISLAVLAGTAVIYAAVMAVSGSMALLSDFGSRMGAATLGQVAPDAVIVTLRRPLTRENTVTRPVWLMAR